MPKIGVAILKAARPCLMRLVFMASARAFCRQCSGATLEWVSLELHYIPFFYTLCLVTALFQLILTEVDLCGALLSDGTQTTLLHPSKWLPEGYRTEDAHQLFQSVKSPDMHANYAVYLCVKATELVSDRTKFVELGEDNGCTPERFRTRWLSLWNDLQCWFSERPSELLPVQTVNRKPFPHILFVHWAAISSNQLYHTACILLLKMMPKEIRLPRSPTLFPLWHARRICGISLANPHQGCLNNSIQPLWIAGQLFSHASEHEEIIRLIQSIEAETGWGTCWRIRDLEVAWGCSGMRGT